MVLAQWHAWTLFLPGIVVFVSGQLLVEGETHPLKFSQVFHLLPANGSYFVLNDMFRLNYA